MTDHRADSGIGERLDDRHHRVRVEIRVGVDEAEDVAASPPDALRHRAALPVVPAEVDDVQLRPALLRLEHPRPGRVGRAVVHDDDLEEIGRIVDREARLDRPDDALLLVEGGHDDRHRRSVSDVGDRPVEQRRDEPAQDVDHDGDRVAREHRVARERRERQVLRHLEARLSISRRLAMNALRPAASASSSVAKRMTIASRFARARRALAL